MKIDNYSTKFGKIYIKRLPSYIIVAILTCIFLRVLFLCVSALFDTVPYICFDDLHIYRTIEAMKVDEILNKLVFRNIYYMISLYLNPYSFGEYISAARALNFVVFILLIVKLDEIMELFDVDKKTRKILSMLLAISPYYIIYSLVQLREVLCAYFVLYLFCAFVSFEKNKKIPWIRVVAVAILLYYTRTYVIEVLAVILICYKSKGSKWYIKFLLVTIIVFAVWYFINDEYYMYVLNNKFNFYVTGEESGGGSGLLSKIKITGIHNIYNILFLIPYSQITPLPGAYQTEYYDFNSWASLITYASGIAAFFLPYFWSNTISTLFSKKKSVYPKLLLVFYLCFLLIIAATEAHNSRFMFFTTPIFYFFGVEGFVKAKQADVKNILLGVICMFIPYFYILF